jgi:hypothetical protein
MATSWLALATDVPEYVKTTAAVLKAPPVAAMSPATYVANCAPTALSIVQQLQQHRKPR